MFAQLVGGILNMFLFVSNLVAVAGWLAGWPAGCAGRRLLFGLQFVGPFVRGCVVRLSVWAVSWRAVALAAWFVGCAPARLAVIWMLFADGPVRLNLM